MTLEKAIRKRDQHWEMAGLARHDNHEKDAARHTLLARAYNKFIAEQSSEEELLELVKLHNG